MARQAVGWRIYKRARALWIWWPDGSGGKVRGRLVDEHGGKLEVGAPARLINESGAAMYTAWCRLAESPAKEDLTILGLTDAFSRAHVAGWKSLSIKNYALWMRNLEEYLGPDTLLAKVSPRRAEELKQWLLAKPISSGGTLSTRSVKDRMELYERMWNWAMRMELVGSNPFGKITRVVSTPTREKAPFTSADVANLLRTAQREMAWFYPLVLTVAITGSRRGPLPLMEVRDFDAERGILKARDEISKRNHGQSYYLPKFLVEILQGITAGREPHEPLFRTRKNRPLSMKVFDRTEGIGSRPPPEARAWFRLQVLAGVQPRGIHNLRRAAVTNLASADVTMEKITAVTGQTPEVAREHYLSLSSASQRETMEKLADLYGGFEGASGRETSEVVLRVPLGDAAELAKFLEGVVNDRARDSGTNSGTNERSRVANRIASNDKEKWRTGGDSNPS